MLRVLLVAVGLPLASAVYQLSEADGCPSDYHAQGDHDPDWISSPAGASWGFKCYRDATAMWGEKPWQFCFEVCQNGLYCGSSYCGASNLVTVMSTEEEEWIAANFASGSDHPTTGDIWLGYGYVTPESVGHYMQTPADAGEGVWLWLASAGHRPTKTGPPAPHRARAVPR